MRSAQAKLLIEAPVNGGRNYEDEERVTVETVL